MVSIREGEEVVIPCRGSVENLNVTLNTVRKSCFWWLFSMFSRTRTIFPPFLLLSKSVSFCVCQKYTNKELHPDGKETQWDARKGFIVPSHVISFAGVVSCQTRIGAETFKSPLYIVAVVGEEQVTTLQCRLCYSGLVAWVKIQREVGEHCELLSENNGLPTECRACPAFFRRIQDLRSDSDPGAEQTGCGGAASAELHGHH